MGEIRTHYGASIALANGDAPFLAVRGDRISIDGLHLAEISRFTGESQRKLRNMVDGLNEGIRNKIWLLSEREPPLDVMVLLFDNQQPWLACAGRFSRNEQGHLMLLSSSTDGSSVIVTAESRARVGWSIMPRW